MPPSRLNNLPASSSPAFSRPALWILLLAAVVIWGANLDYRKLSLSDEGRYSEIPRYMAQSGDWITPRLNGIKYFEKPPLQYWATAAAYRLFGEHHWSARIWPALTGLAGVLVIFFAGSRLFGAASGIYAAMVLGSSLLYVAMAHILTLDMGLAFFLALAMCAILLALSSPDRRSERRWISVAAVACALAVLSKGLIGVVLPGAVVVLYIVLKRDLGLLRRLHLAWSTLLFLAVCAPWFVAVSVANPEFAHFFFIHEHFQRYTSTIHARHQPWFFFIPIFLLGTMPWLITVFAALIDACRRQRSDGFDPVLFLLLWIGFTFVFFSASGSKLPSYILPMFPAVALLCGRYLSQATARAFGWQLLPAIVVGILGLAAAPLTVRLASEAIPEQLYREQIPWLAAAAAAMLAGGGTAAYFCWKSRLQAGIVACALTGLVSVQLLVTSQSALAPAHSTYFLVQRLQPYLKPNTPFYSVGSYEQTLPFYLKRTITLVAFQDEMAFGLKHEPQLWIENLDDFKTIWLQHHHALAVMGLDMLERLGKEGLPMEIVASDTERAFVRTPNRALGTKDQP